MHLSNRIADLPSEKNKIRYEQK